MRLKAISFFEIGRAIKGVGKQYSAGSIGHPRVIRKRSRCEIKAGARKLQVQKCEAAQ